MMTRLVKWYNMRFKTGVNIFFLKEITGIRSQVTAIFIENHEVVLGDFNYLFFTWCCEWAQMVHLVESYKKHLKIGSILIF
jgi:hypothetical protein